MVPKKYLKLNDLNAYKISFHLSNYTWVTILKWDYFSKNTVGMQYARAIDSISANIAEGFGRYGRKDKIKFYYYSFGSLNESLDWTEKAYRRDLLSQEQYKYILSELKKLPQEINHLINFTKNKLEK